ncbi:MAG: DUF962 domain-containing protein [Vulcanimicrobiaceae bacterium]
MQREHLFSEYGSYHADPRNRACHAVGIPLIVLGLLGVLALVSVGPVNLAVLVGLALLVFYATFDLSGALISAVIFAALYALAIHLSWQYSTAAFVIGWVFQLIGHRYEGNKPKFLENLIYLLIGPLYVFEEVVMSPFRRKPASN